MTSIVGVGFDSDAHDDKRATANRRFNEASIRRLDHVLIDVAEHLGLPLPAIGPAQRRIGNGRR
jgi:hypothetical protein